ncbi:MAG: helix-turn-helix transcriptional regulator [Ruminococcaceae bacterium]|nr:helix-turn-helix transcriptional regulator [Oscillospiraceae bacterium]
MKGGLFMTTGEKIQYYRKKIGLSQEELGQKMLVSRQTVSLWEMDKTLPTVDNLIRLKEIFSVSIDDILSEAEPIEENKNEPNEAYVFKYEKSDLQEVFKKVRFPLIKRAIIFTLACIVLFIFFAASDAPDIMLGLLLGYFLLGVISHIKGYFAYGKAWKSNENKILQCTYSYEIFDGYFILNISKNEEITRTLKIYFDDIEKIHSFGNYLVLQVAGQSYIIKKDALIPESALIAFCNNTPNKVEAKKPKDKLKIISILLFVLSICTIWGALIGVAILSGINQAMTENMWIFFLFLPVPIASIVFGFYLKKKGYKYKKNVIVGIIMAALLCIYGSFTFIFSDIYSHGDEPIVNTEQMLNIDIPTHSRINTQDWTKGTQSVPRGYIYSTSDIYFDDTAVEQFEKNISNDAKWISDIPNDMVGITSYFCDIQTSNYYIIYNKDTGEFNKLPSASGTYVFINVLYNAESNTMKLVEYQIEYTK